MRSGAWWQRRVTHVGMRLLLLLLLRLRGMSVNHPAPGKHSTSFRNHFFFGWDIYEVALSLTTGWSSALILFSVLFRKLITFSGVHNSKLISHINNFHSRPADSRSNVPLSRKITIALFTNTYFPRASHFT